MLIFYKHRLKRLFYVSHSQDVIIILKYMCAVSSSIESGTKIDTCMLISRLDIHMYMYRVGTIVVGSVYSIQGRQPLDSTPLVFQPHRRLRTINTKAVLTGTPEQNKL